MRLFVQPCRCFAFPRVLPVSLSFLFAFMNNDHVCQKDVEHHHFCVWCRNEAYPFNCFGMHMPSEE